MENSLSRRLAQTFATADGRLPSMHELVADRLADPPRPGRGQTLERWRALAEVAAHDLSLAKLYEGHADAVAILAEAGQGEAGGVWGCWAAEPPGARVVLRGDGRGGWRVNGKKAWCSGAEAADHGLLTAWAEDGRGPFLAVVDMRQPGVVFDRSTWAAVGMPGSHTVDVHFRAVPARVVGDAGFYLERPGFWQGGAGIAACWHGASCAIARHLHEQTRLAGDPGWHRLHALGNVDRLLSANAALLREAASWIDAHPCGDARDWALRARAATEMVATQVLEFATRALGANALCRNAHYARLAADLPVYVRQSHGDRDLVALGERLRETETPPWTL